MSLFAKLFKPNQPVTVEQRIAQLNTLEQSQLLNIVRAAEPSELRLAAAKKLSYSNDLLKLVSDESIPPKLLVATRKRLGELLDSQTVELERLYEDITEQKLLFEVCAYSNRAGPMLVEKLSDEALLAELAKQGSTTQIRQAACARIDSKPLLEGLLDYAKQRDKSVYRIVKNKLKQFKQEQAKIDAEKQELASLCYQAEQLTKHKIDDVFYARLTQLNEAWKALQSSADANLITRFESAINLCQEQVQAQLKQLEDEEKQRLAEREAKKDVYNVIDQLTSLVVAQYTESAGLTAQTLEALTEQKNLALQQASENSLDCRKENKTIEQLLTALQKLHDLAQSNGPFIEALTTTLSTESASAKDEQTLQDYLVISRVLAATEQPETITQAQEFLQQRRSQARQNRAEQDELIGKFNELLRKGLWASKGGHASRARAILRDAESLAEKIHKTPPQLAKKYDDFISAVNKLGDWHDFAVTPKKQALVEEMQSLIGSPLAPQPLAERIQALQQSWKELCRGGQNNDEDLWEAFHKASQEAYQPCKEFFEEQNQQRDGNSANRRTLIQQLTDYLNAYNWEEADWAEVENTLKVAREAWQSYWPVARKDIKALQSQFDEIMDTLYGKVHEEYDKNCAKKQAIVDQAAKLPDMDNGDEAIEQAKRLQGQWKLIGRCKRKDDHQLWKKFRQSCDEVFSRRQQEFEKRRQDQDSNLDAAQSIVESIEKIATLEGDEFFTEKSKLDELVEHFNSLEELPKNRVQKVKARFNDALRAVDAQTERLRHSAAIDNWKAIFSLSGNLLSIEHSPETDPQKVAEFKEALTEHPRWPSNSKKALEHRIEQLEQGAPIDPEAAIIELRKLCVKAEVAMEVETPEGDKTLRMEYQVEQLQQGLQQQHKEDNFIDQLLDQWLSVRGCPEAEYETYKQRFFKTLGW